MFYRSEQSQGVIKKIYSNRQILYAIGFLEAFGGLTLFVKSSAWEKFWFGTIMEYFAIYMAFEGLAYLLLPEKLFAVIPAMMENRKVNMAVSLFYVFLSLILIYALLLTRKM